MTPMQPAKKPGPGGAVLAPNGQVRVQELMPGDVALGYAGDQFKTLLGSCICVILTDARRTVAALSHIVHVSRPNSDNARNTAYGSVAMEAMFQMLGSTGAIPSRCQAYVYGGGNMFPGQYVTETVGARNARWVLQFLKDQGIVVIDVGVEGSGYRKISWIVGTAEPKVEMVAVEPEVPDAH